MIEEILGLFLCFVAGFYIAHLLKSFFEKTQSQKKEIGALTETIKLYNLKFEHQNNFNRELQYRVNRLETELAKTQESLTSIRGVFEPQK